MRQAPTALSALLLLVAPGCADDAPPDNQGIELYVSAQWPLVIGWSPVAEQRGFEDGTVDVDVDDQRPAPGAVALTLNGQPVPESPDSAGRFPVGAAGLAPLPPGGRITLEARTVDGRAATFTFVCPGEVPVVVSPDPIVKGSPVTVWWSGPIFLETSPLSAAPLPHLASCAYDPGVAPSAMRCDRRQSLAPQQRSATLTPLAYYSGRLGYLIELEVVGDQVQQHFQRPSGIQFHQGICSLRQRFGFAAVDP